MAEPQPAAQVAKELNIYLGQIYPLVQKGLVKNHKPDGKYNVEGGKGLIVDIEEVRAAMSGSRKKGGKGSRGPKAGSRAHAKADPSGAAIARRVSKEDFPVGTVISVKPYVPHIQFHAVTGRYRHMVYMDRKPGATTDTLMWTDSARMLLAKGIAKIERPEAVLGMIMFSWLANDRLDLASGLEEWMESVGLEVAIPDPIVVDVPDEYELPEAPELEEELSGDDDED